jgi:hypothetical protein
MGGSKDRLSCKVVKEPISYNTNPPVINQAVQQTPTPQYQPIPVAKPVIETTTPPHQNYQQPKPKQPVNDSKYCRYLETDFAIAECVRGN